MDARSNQIYRQNAPERRLKFHIVVINMNHRVPFELVFAMFASESISRAVGFIRPLWGGALYGHGKPSAS